MKIYKSNYKYQVALSILTVFSGFVILSSGIWDLKSISIFSVTTILILPLVWGLFSLWLPQKITIQNNTMELKTLLTNKKISFSEIKDIKPYYSTKSKMWYGGDEEKADMICVIKLKGNLFNLFILTNAIANYKELYHTINKKAGLFLEDVR